MKIQNFFRLSAIVACLFLLTMGALLVDTTQTQARRHRRIRHHLHVYQLAHDLAWSIDASTRMARAYVATGNPSYKRNYFKALDLRDVRLLSPPGASLKFGWPDANARMLPLPLLTLMRREDMPESGLRLMRKTKQNLDAMASLDRQAMAAVDGLYDDGHGNFIVHRASDSTFANRLLNSKHYLGLRTGTLAALEDFLAMQSRTINSEMRDSRRRQKQWLQLMGGLAMVGVIATAAAVSYARRRILRPLDDLNRQATSIASGNYTARCEIRMQNEIAELGRNFNHMAESIERDIAARKANEGMIWKQANFDVLTGLPNRHMFLDRLDLHIKKAHRTGRSMVLMFIDLDHFKEVNDTLGHGMGDLLLKKAARRLGACIRATDTVARLGGDEFTLILDEMDSLDRAACIAKDILQQLARPYRLENEIAWVTASIGITVYPNDALTIQEMLMNADQAMYSAKSQGRNRYDFFTVSMQVAAQARRQLGKDLRAALAAEQLCVFYQPIVSMASGAIHKAEALVRWQHPDRGLISPAEFIPIAEETGLIVDIGNWVFREAARQAAHWQATHHIEFQVSVNTSPVQYRNGGIDCDAWCGHLKALGLSGNSIAIEITEGLLMEGTGAVSEQLLRLRRGGLQISLDDFGTGYSSLSYLKKFHVDYLKIDQVFVQNITSGSDDLVLCEAMIALAHRLGLKVVAEGIETTEQRDLLLASGCDYGQGYLYSRPLPALEFDELLEHGNRTQDCSRRSLKNSEIHQMDLLHQPL